MCWVDEKIFSKEKEQYPKLSKILISYHLLVLVTEPLG